CVQDAWRLRPNLTINAGVRYDVQYPFYPLNSVYSFATIGDVCGVSGAKSAAKCNLFQAGSMPGTKPTYKQYTAGTHAYDIDKNNIAPNVGFAWTPAAGHGFLGSLVGQEGDFVIRGGYTRSYKRGGPPDLPRLLGRSSRPSHR